MFMTFATSYLSADRLESRRKTNLARDLILLNRDEIQLFVEMHFTQRSFLDHSMVELAFDFHHE
jgi:hypothetical protein